MTTIDFYNDRAESLLLWIESACIDVDLDMQHEYRLESEETEFYIKFQDTAVTIYLIRGFGLKLFKRPYSNSSKPHDDAKWEFVEESLDF